MKLLLTSTIFLLALTANCASPSSNTSVAAAPAATSATPNPEAHSATAKEYYKDGWDNLKQGSKKVAHGVSESANEAGTAIHSVACPIAADRNLGVYYAKDSPGYEKMLSAEKSNVRECFSSEAGAREKGYSLVR